MSVGTRQQPEKQLDSLLKPNSFQRISRKWIKKMHNRKERRAYKLDPEQPPFPKYKGWEW